MVSRVKLTLEGAARIPQIVNLTRVVTGLQMTTPQKSIRGASLDPDQEAARSGVSVLLKRTKH